MPYDRYYALVIQTHMVMCRERQNAMTGIPDGPES